MAGGVARKERPLVGAAVSVILGTWSGFVWPCSPGGAVVVLAALAGIVGALVWVRRRAIGPHPSSPALNLAVMAMVVVVSWGSNTWRQARLDRVPPLDDLENGAPVTIVGVVAGDPDIAKPPRGVGYRWTFPLRVEGVQSAPQAPVPARGVVRVRWYGPPPGYTHSTGGSGGRGPAYGERWQLSGELRKRIGRGRVPFYFSLSSGRRTSERLAILPGTSLARKSLATRRKAARILTVGIDDFPQPVALLRALLLGYRSDLRGEMRDLFAAVGTLHIFAISGLHVGIFASLIIFVLAVLTIPRTHWVLFLAPVLIAYTFATGGRSSAVRACVMAIIYFAAPLFWRKGDALSALALAALLIVSVRPDQIYSIGFIYSFTVALGLILLYPVIHSLLAGIIREGGMLFSRQDPSAGAGPLFWEKDAMQVQPEPVHRPRMRAAIHSVASLATLSWAAWLASVPLTAFFFGRFSPIALVGNIAVIPLAFLVVVTGCLSLVSGGVLLLFADVFNHANLALMSLLVVLMKGLGNVPGGSMEIPAFELWQLVAWYVVLGCGVGWHCWNAEPRTRNAER